MREGDLERQWIVRGLERSPREVRLCVLVGGGGEPLDVLEGESANYSVPSFVWAMVASPSSLAGQLLGPWRQEHSQQ